MIKQAVTEKLSFSRAGVRICAVLGAGLAAAPGAALAAPNRPPVTPLGVIKQLSGRSGCLADRTARPVGCTPVRALRGPGPFLGSEAIAVSSDGRNVYVASANSNAIAVFRRNPSSGALTQAAGAAGCIAAGGANGCGRAVGLLHPNSVAVSADGRNVYATAYTSNAILTFQRNSSTGALTQTGCIAASPTRGCTAARALSGPDVVAVSHDGHNVYVGAFKGNAVAVFSRSASSGALVQLFGAGGCIVSGGGGGCASGIAMLNPEGVAVSGDGKNVYVAAPGSSALDVLARDASTGALTQATGGSGCFTNTPLAGCTTGRQLGAADAVAVSPDDKSVYVTALLTRSVANFARSSNGQLTQPSSTTGCAIYVLAVACTLGRALQSPEGLAVSPDGANVYVVSIQPGSFDVFDRTASTSGLMEKPRRPGCFVSKPKPDCSLGRAIGGVTSVAVSPDGRNVYSTASSSNAVDVFKRNTQG
jgi:DNA-binding beta-propeller fold protein YncE